MTVFEKKSELKAFLAPHLLKKDSLGFVPTMGALHEGHLSLMRESLKKNKITVVSIFVNPTQFNNAEDLKKYPRTIHSDLLKIKTLNPNIIVYCPEIEDIYDTKVLSKSFDFDGLEFQMEGKHRPGHFDGVGTIVKELFEIILPTNAYFGEKDYQQLAIVTKLASKYNLPVNIIGCKIHREQNGLAMSSRNERLSSSQREEAKIIYESLQEAKKLFVTKSTKEVNKWVVNKFQQQSEFTLEYFEIADEETLLTCTRKNKSKNYRAFIAVFINNIRLIDNISLK